jgi:hypothetical protein
MIYANKSHWSYNCNSNDISDTIESINHIIRTKTYHLSKASIRGALASIQNDASTLKPSWIVYGVFRMDNANATSPVFNATFYMIKINGTASHQHTISDFKLNAAPITNNNSTIFNGISTITMNGSSVKDVPTSITFMDESAVSIWLDPSKTKNHFGNTAIYGAQHLICVELPNYCFNVAS